MKKLFFIVITFAALITSCSSEDAAGVTTPNESVAATIAAYVSDNYPETEIVSTSGTGSSFTTTLNTGEELVFNTSGTFIAYANNYSAGLSADSISLTCDSTSTNSVGHDGRGHGGKGGHGKGKGGKGGHGNHYGQAGDSMHVGDRKHGHNRNSESEIAIDSLSTSVNDYIAANYSGYIIIHAEVDTICQGVVTEVLVCTSSTEPVKLIFDETGTFLMTSRRIEYTDVPVEVSAAITANYATYNVKKRAALYTLADGSLQYKVFMSLDGVRKSVTFNTDGTVNCEK